MALITHTGSRFQDHVHAFRVTQAQDAQQACDRKAFWHHFLEWLHNAAMVDLRLLESAMDHYRVESPRSIYVLLQLALQDAEFGRLFPLSLLASLAAPESRTSLS